MGHGDAGNGLVGGELLVDPVGQRDPVLGVHLGAAHVDYLLRQDLGKSFGLRDTGQHLLDGELAPVVAVIGEVGAGLADERDGAARAEQIHAR